jgi:steroid delta-isomerase-like uncharacterized protein
MATTATPSDIARALFNGVFGERDLDPDRYWSSRSVNHFVATGETVRGGEELAAWFRRLFASVPDWSIEVENVLDDADRTAVVQWHATGTFDGEPFQGIVATGRRIDLRGVDVIRCDADGKVEENTVYYDGAEFARQVGLLPARGSSADRAMLSAFNTATRVRRSLGPQLLNARE